MNSKRYTPEYSLWDTLRIQSSYWLMCVKYFFSRCAHCGIWHVDTVGLDIRELLCETCFETQLDKELQEQAELISNLEDYEDWCDEHDLDPEAHWNGV